MIKAFHSDLDVTASTIDDLKLLIKMHKCGICPSFHLNFNTGMNRLGFDYNQCELVFSLLKENPEVPLKGIYSHLQQLMKKILNMHTPSLILLKK